MDQNWVKICEMPLIWLCNVLFLCKNPLKYWEGLKIPTWDWKPYKAEILQKASFVSIFCVLCSHASVASSWLILYPYQERDKWTVYFGANLDNFTCNIIDFKTLEVGAIKWPKKKTFHMKFSPIMILSSIMLVCFLCVTTTNVGPSLLCVTVK